MRYQSGQSLIETIIAIFILTSTLVAGLGLAIYAFSASATSRNQIIASNLAREGIEVLRYMRDTNWLEGGSKGGTWGLQACSDIGKDCYPSWLTGPSGSGYHNYDISPSNNQNRWRLEFSPSTNSWVLGNNSSYNLYLQSDGTYTHVVNGTSFFSRRMIVTYCNSTSNPACPNYTTNNPEVYIQAVVGWRGKNCIWSGEDPTVAPASCKVTVEEHLTNWKDYK